MAQVRDCLNKAAQLGVPAADAQVLLAAVLGKPKIWLWAYPEYTLTTAEASTFGDKLVALRAGKPLPYLIGEWEFYCLPFYVSPAVLIPRPETELLVAHALRWAAQRPADSPLHFGDVGTGSGCIAVTLAKLRPESHGWAVDISPDARAIAAQNVARHAVGARVQLIASDLLQAAPYPVHLLCANLPYIPPAELPALAVSQHEPRLALDGGQPDGLVLVRRLLANLPQVLLPQALVLLEIGAAQGDAAWQAAQTHCPQAHWQILPDEVGRDRILRGDFV